MVAAAYAVGNHAAYRAYLAVAGRVAPAKRGPGESDLALIRRKLRAKHRS